MYGKYHELLQERNVTALCHCFISILISCTILYSNNLNFDEAVSVLRIQGNRATISLNFRG